MPIWKRLGKQGRGLVGLSFASSSFVLASAVASCSSSDTIVPAADAAATDASPTADTSSIDAPALDGSAIDSGSDVSSGCDLLKPFGAPVLVPGLPQLIFAGSLSPDELTIYFVRDVGNTGQVFYATRPTTADPFGAKQPIPNVNVRDYMNRPAVTGDGLTMYVDGYKISGPRDMFFATRAATSQPFGVAKLVPSLANTTSKSLPFVLADGSRVYFQDGSFGGSGNTFAYMDCNSGGCGSSNGLSMNGLLQGSMRAVLTSDQLTIYYTSDNGQNKGNKIYKMTRANSSAVFDNRAVVAELNGTSVDEPVWLSADDCRIYIDSDRNGFSQVFVASHPSK